jgi:hypothetical protein
MSIHFYMINYIFIKGVPFIWLWARPAGSLRRQGPPAGLVDLVVDEDLVVEQQHLVVDEDLVVEQQHLVVDEDLNRSREKPKER